METMPVTMRPLRQRVAEMAGAVPVEVVGFMGLVGFWEGTDPTIGAVRLRRSWGTQLWWCCQMWATRRVEQDGSCFARWPTLVAMKPRRRWGTQIYWVLTLSAP